MNKTILITLVVLLFAVPAFAQPSDDALASGEIWVERREVAGANAPSFIVMAVINSPAEKVWEVVSNCDKFSERLPNVRNSRFVERKPGEDICEVTTALPMPLSDLTAQTRARITISGERRVRAWTLLEGDYTKNEGSWTLERFQSDPNRTLVTYKIHATTRRSMPGWVANRMENRSLPGVIKRLREEAARIIR